MKLMIFYEYTHSKRLFYKLMDIDKGDNSAKAVDDYIRSLKGWKNSIRLSLRKDPHMPEPGFVAYYIQDEKDVKEGCKKKKIKVNFHNRDDKKAVNRKAYCSFIDTLSNNSRKGRKVLKQVAECPDTNDFEIEYLMELLLKNVRYHKNKLH